MSKAVTKVEKNQVVASAAADEFADFAGSGMENVTSNDVLIPRLSILQSLSPQLKKNKSEYIEGAAVGQIADLGTGELFPDGIIFLPLYYRKDYLEWAPRDSGKGLVAIHSDPSILNNTVLNDKRKPVLPNGNYIAETAQFFGFNVTADFRQSFIPMASTQLKKARKWLTLATGEKLTRPDGSSFTPPLWYRCYSLSTVYEDNAQGDWYGWQIERSVPLPEVGSIAPVDWHELKQRAIKFAEQIRSGEARADESHLQAAETDNEPAM